TQRSSWMSPHPSPGSLFTDPPFVASGRLGWFGQQDQVVIASWFQLQVTVITFDADLNMTLSSANLPDFAFPFGLTIGRFDPPDVSGTANPNLQIALLLEVPADFEYETALFVYTVDPSSNNFSPQLAATHLVAGGQLFPGLIDTSGLVPVLL